MIKKKLFKYGSVFMCAALMACSLTACGTNSASVQQATAVSVAAANDTENTLQNAINSQMNSAVSTTGSKVSTSGSKNSKEETVYVFTDVTGKQDHLIINEKLKNSTGLSTIEDVSSLSNIKNLTGDEKSTSGSDNKLTWAADGNSITYQGTSTQQVPVTIKVTYYLDDKEISADKLAGQSGKVKIRFDYTNNEKKTINVNGKVQTAYVPFTMITGMLLPTDKFSNIEVTNGKISEVNDSNIVLGVAMPGLKDSLDLKLDNKDIDIDIPEYFEVTADVKDFELETVMSVATSSIFADVDLDNIDVSDVKDQMNDLTDATGQLIDGTGELQDGTGQLKDGSGKLKDGTDTLVDGTGKLLDGSNALADGTEQLSDGADQLADGTGKLLDGAGQLADGTNELNSQVPTLTSGVKQLDDGAGQLADGTGKLFAKMPTLVDGITQLNTGSGQLSDGTNKLQAGIQSFTDQLKAGTTQLADEEKGLPALQSGISQYTSGIETAEKGAGKLDEGAATLSAGLEKLADNFSGDGTEANPGIVDGIAQLAGGSTQINAGLTKLEQVVSDTITTMNGQAGQYASNKEVLQQAKQTETAADAAQAALGGASLNMVLAQLGAAASTDLTIKPYTDLSGINALTADTVIQNLYLKYMNAYTFVISNQTNATVQQINAALTALHMPTLPEIYATEMGALVKTISNQSIAGALTNVSTTMSTQTDPETGLTLQESIGALVSGSAALKTGIIKIQDGIGTKAELSAQNPVAAPTTVCQALNALVTGSGMVKSGTTELKTGLSTAVSKNETINNGVASAVEGVKKLDAGVSTGASQLLDKETGVPALVDGATQLKNGLGQLVEATPELSTGVNALNDGAKQLKVGTAKLNDGAGALALGVGKLNDGAGALKTGANDLNDGAGALKTGANDLNDGAHTLNSGVSDLNDGAKDLNSGMSELNDGVIKLADGAIELKDGMIKFNEEGIEKITKMLGTDAPDITETLKKVVQLGKDYQSFAGKSDNTDGTVTFIYKTEGITK